MSVLESQDERGRHQPCQAGGRALARRPKRQASPERGSVERSASAAAPRSGCGRAAPPARRAAARPRPAVPTTRRASARRMTMSTASLIRCLGPAQEIRLLAREVRDDHVANLGNCDPGACRRRRLLRLHLSFPRADGHDQPCGTRRPSPRPSTAPVRSSRRAGPRWCRCSGAAWSISAPARGRR